MFDRLKKVFGTPGTADDAPRSQGRGEGPLDAVGEWAAAQGLAYTGFGEGKGFSVTGQIQGRPWKLERGRSSRDYMRGDELRARAELKVNDDAAVLIINRPLKEALEKKAYQMYTDTLQTTADPSLPEEMRWLAMYPEAGWDSLPKTFWSRYAVLADQREHAQLWLDADLAAQLMSWPHPGPDEQVPFILMLLRGKAYLRMQYTPSDLPTLAHAGALFTRACTSAVAGLGADIPL
ncbi:MAG: hypothetical protein JWQ72_1529 [Polaromonas sp.]|nr:hypothetical protein [Polaromonas sp.]